MPGTLAPERVPKCVGGVLKAVLVMVKAVHATHHYHWSEVNLNLTEVILGLKVDNPVAVVARLGVSL